MKMFIIPCTELTYIAYRKLCEELKFAMASIRLAIAGMGTGYVHVEPLELTC